MCMALQSEEGVSTAILAPAAGLRFPVLPAWTCPHSSHFPAHDPPMNYLQTECCFIRSGNRSLWDQGGRGGASKLRGALQGAGELGNPNTHTPLHLSHDNTHHTHTHANPA